MSGEILTQITNSVAWFLVGLATGYFAGRLRREVREIREVVVDGEPPPPHRARPSTRTIGIIVILLAVATVAQGVVFERQQARVVACQARFTEAFIDALRIRTRIADEDRTNVREDRDSLNRWLSQLLALKPGDRTSGRRITETYLAEQAALAAQRKELDAQRAATPLPTLPKECG